MTDLDLTRIGSTSHPGDTEYFFFGAPGQELFGSYHPPRSDRTRDSAVLLCYPWGKEYLPSHRAFRQLAELLSGLGYPVLRFDYRGTGDSAGDGASDGLSTWIDDIATALDELRERAMPEQICLIGLRLGASLAMRASTEHDDVSGLVLWQPVLDGAEYLAELREHHRAMLWQHFPSVPDAATGDAVHELLGFPVSSELLQDLQSFRLSLAPAWASPLLIVDNLPESRLDAWQRQRGDDGHAVEYAVLPTFTIWGEDIDKGLVPRPTLERIAMWLEAQCP
ncbi:MAG: alpha/beta fold hydrolase [Chloroflexi bacterium]|nr:alpha/beta fold hydrolase [Chloroflexota bacterium]